MRDTPYRRFRRGYPAAAAPSAGAALHPLVVARSSITGTGFTATLDRAIGEGTLCPISTPLFGQASWPVLTHVCAGPTSAGRERRCRIIPESATLLAVPKRTCRSARGAPLNGPTPVRLGEETLFLP